MPTISTLNSIAIANLSSYSTRAKASISTINTITMPAAVTYATRNPSDKSANISLSWWNLVATATNTAWKSVRATIGKSSWKRYWEVVVQIPSGTWNAMVGIWRATVPLSSYLGNDLYWRAYYSYISKADAKNAYNNNVNLTYWSAFVKWDVIWVALDMDNWTLEFYRNNTSQWVLATWLSWTYYPMVSPNENTSYHIANFGATPLTYTPPSGFNAGLYV